MKRIAVRNPLVVVFCTVLAACADAAPRAVGPRSELTRSAARTSGTSNKTIVFGEVIPSVPPPSWTGATASAKASLTVTGSTIRGTVTLDLWAADAGGQALGNTWALSTTVRRSGPWPDSSGAPVYISTIGTAQDLAVDASKQCNAVAFAQGSFSYESFGTTWSAGPTLRPVNSEKTNTSACPDPNPGCQLAQLVMRAPESRSSPLRLLGDSLGTCADTTHTPMPGGGNQTTGGFWVTGEICWGYDLYVNGIWIQRVVEGCSPYQVWIAS